MSQSSRNLNSRARVADRQMTELIGIVRGMMADGTISDGEIEYLRRWLAASEGASGHPLIAGLALQFDALFADGTMDPEAREDLVATLNLLVGEDFEIGEAMKSSRLPFCDPAPGVTFDGAVFCFTGKFAFGQRKDCDAAVIERGGTAGELTQRTRVLVIGEYATEDWSQSSWGRKIEKAVKWRSEGVPISIVSETHWRRFMT